MSLTTYQRKLMDQVAVSIGAKPDDLFELIKFETAGTFSPTIKNPNSTARGLIQFTDGTARNLGFADSLDLVTQNPTVETQLLIVKKYLEQFRPFPTKQSLFMSVFLPAARNADPLALLPKWARDANPGIQTVADYMAKASGAAGKIVTIILAVAGFFLLKL